MYKKEVEKMEKITEERQEQESINFGHKRGSTSKISESDWGCETEGGNISYLNHTDLLSIKSSTQRLGIKH